MKIQNKSLIVILLIPILSLILLTGYKAYKKSSGEELNLPIRGYDPRDLISGHYLTYQVDYDVEGVCKSFDNRIEYSEKFEAFICLQPKYFSTSHPKNCQRYIKGECQGSRFIAGIEKFFIPEEHALKLEKLIQNNSAEISISLQENGKAMVHDLLIQGQSWQELIKK